MTFGRLERTQRPSPISEINMTPLVDVMLVLVVILLITAPLLASSIKLELPAAAGASAVDGTPFVALAVDQSGHAFFNDKAVDLAELATQLQHVAQANPQTEVQLRADQRVPYGKIVAVMGVAQQAGLNRIGFVAEVAPGAAAPGRP